MKFSPTEGKCQKEYRQLQGQIMPCQEINFDSMTEELQTYYLDRYEGVQAHKHQVHQFHDFGAVSTTYWDKTDRKEKLS